MQVWYLLAFKLQINTELFDTSHTYSLLKTILYTLLYTVLYAEVFTELYTVQ